MSGGFSFAAFFPYVASAIHLYSFLGKERKRAKNRMLERERERERGHGINEAPWDVAAGSG